ncbi:MAG: ABC transporter substrate-binding protein, partial [Planctomycetia bacterium]
AGDIVWATYRETQTLDPIQAFDYPENTTVSLLCDAMLRTGPDMVIGPGLTTMTNPTPTTLDFKIGAGAKFWDGNPVTTDDVIYSLQRAADPNGGGFYSAMFSRVESIKASAADTVEITLKQPDFWLPGELSSTAGMVYEKAYAVAKGKDFGTVTGGIMCSGPFKLDSWKTGQGVTVVPNADYWDSSLPKPKFNKLTIIGVPDDATFTAGVKTGEISGGWYNPLSTLGQLQSDPNVHVYQGAPFATSAMVISATKGPLANPLVRQAVSYALDRKGVIATVFKGAATMPHALMASGTWGYSPDVFGAAYDALPALDQDMTKAMDLIQQAGAAGQTIIFNSGTGTGGFGAAANGVATVTFTAAPTNTNLIISPWAVAQVAGSGAANDASFIGAGTTLTAFAGTPFVGTGSTATTVYTTNAASPTVTATEAMYGLQLQAANNVLTLNSGVTLTIGAAAGFGGLIMNGNNAAINAASGTPGLTLGTTTGAAYIYVGGTGSAINVPVTQTGAGTVTVFGPGSLALTPASGTNA